MTICAWAAPADSARASDAGGSGCEQLHPAGSCVLVFPGLSDAFAAQPVIGSTIAERGGGAQFTSTRTQGHRHCRRAGEHASRASRARAAARRRRAAAPRRAAARAGRPSGRRRRRRRPPPAQRPRRHGVPTASSSALGAKAAFTSATWRGWMQSLAPKPKPARAGGVGAQRLAVVERGADAVDRRREPGQPRGEHELRAEHEQLVAVAGDAEVELQVDRPEGEPLHAGRRRHLAHVRRCPRPSR